MKSFLGVVIAAVSIASSPNLSHAQDNNSACGAILCLLQMSWNPAEAVARSVQTTSKTIFPLSNFTMGILILQEPSTPG